MVQRLPHLMTVLIVSLGLLAWWQSTQGFRAFTWESYRRLQVAAHPITVPNVELEDQWGHRQSITSLRGKVLIINFIYTRCPTVCGYTGLNLSRLQRKLQQRGYQDRVRLLSISLDPQYDTPPKLKAYMQRFTQRLDTSWQTVRPVNQQEGKNLLQQLGVVSIPDGIGGITHNAATHIVDQQGRLVRIINEDNIDLTLNIIQELLVTKTGSNNV